MPLFQPAPSVTEPLPAWLPSLMLATALAMAPATPAFAQTTALVGATVIDGTGGPPISEAVVLVEDGRLRCVGPAASCPVPSDATRVDVSDRYMTPGLVDAHVHFSQTGWVDGRPDGISAPDLYPYLVTSEYNRDHPERWHRTYLCTGITAVYDVGGHPWTTGLPAASENSTVAAHVRAAGPLITHAARSALMANDELYTFLPMDTPDEVSSSVAKLVQMGSSAARSGTYRLRLPGGESSTPGSCRSARKPRPRGSSSSSTPPR